MAKLIKPNFFSVQVGMIRFRVVISSENVFGRINYRIRMVRVRDVYLTEHVLNSGIVPRDAHGPPKCAAT